MTDYLTIADVLAIHADQIERYGGSHGVRDQGLLEAALYRPQTGYYADLIEEAAALWERLSQNRANLVASADETYAFLASLYDHNEFTLGKLVHWLRTHVKHERSS